MPFPSLPFAAQLSSLRTQLAALYAVYLSAHLWGIRMGIRGNSDQQLGRQAIAG